MDSSDFKRIEQILYDYPNTDQYIKIREAKLTYVYRGRSDVLKGIVPVGASLLDCTMTIDRELMQLKINQLCVQYCLEHSDEDTNRIIEELYFKDLPGMTLDQLGKKVLHMTKSNVSKKRSEFFKFLLRELGYL